MADARTSGEEVELHHPNRDKAVVQVTRLTVIVLLIISIVLLLLVTVGGWPALQGLRPIQIAYIFIYVILAVFALRWSRGMLPMAAAAALLLAIFAALSAPGWFSRDKGYYAAPALPESMLGLLVLLIIPVQLLLIILAMRGFQQGWNVEEERHPRREEREPGGARPQPA